jgi:hypothetical protein
LPRSGRPLTYKISTLSRLGNPAAG